MDRGIWHVSELGARYRAFISYSHADAVWGRRIHRGLETYALPKKLIGTTTERGDVPAKLSPIFRDREELSAGVDLSEQVQAALAASDALIVVCSPRAKASFWVGKEIETFRALYPNRPIFAALVEGEPVEAFPDALVRYGDREAEPIAADFRKTADGARLAKLKLVAGLTGVKLDALVQREAQRQWRRVMAVTLVAGTAVLIMATLLVMALRAQSEAERQRAQAEGLVEYMLTDLRDKLKGVGRLDVMTAVNERAMGYYATQATLGDMPPESLERRSRILHAMGEDDEKRGDLGLALKKFEEAHRTTAAILAQKPNDADAIFSHAQSEYWVGEAAMRAKDIPKVKAHFEAYKVLADRLVQLNPNDTNWRRESGYAEGNLCTLALEEPVDRDQALKSCQRALDQMKAVLQLMPKDKTAHQDVANRYAWLADAWKANGNLERAFTSRLQQEAIIGNLRDEYPQDAAIQELWLKTEIMVAEIVAQRGDNDAAERRLRRAYSAYNFLIKHDPSNIQWFKWKLKIIDSQRLIKKDT